MRKDFVTSMVLALAAAAALVTHISAVTCPNGGPFCIEGTIPDAGSQQVTDPNGNASELGPINGADTKIGVIHNAAVPMLGFTSIPAKVDLNTVYLQTQKSGTDVWLYFAWKRDSTTGSGFVSLEADVAASDCDYSSAETLLGCNPWENRASGDFLISWDQQGNSHDIYLRTFDGTNWVTPATCPAPQVTPLGCLLDPTTAVAEYTSNFDGGELALNLTGIGLVQPGVCTTFNNVIPGTVTGNSDTADYKDVVLAPLSIRTCGAITVEKVTQNPAGTAFLDTTSTFHYQITGAASVNIGSNIQAGPLNKKTHADLPAATNYTITEDVIPAGYQLISITCNGANANGVSFSVTEGGTTACVITNRQNPRQVTASTVQFVALRDTMNVTNILRVTGDNNAQFTVDFRLYNSLADCTADTTRTGGTAFTSVPLTFTGGATDAGTAETHPQGQGVHKGLPGTYAWWAKFSGNKVGGNDINLPKESACGTETTTVSFQQ